ncbi:unnamed protein product [Prunus brigantina]
MGRGLVADVRLGKYRASTSPPSPRASPLAWGFVPPFLVARAILPREARSLRTRVRSSRTAALNAVVMMHPGNRKGRDASRRVERGKRGASSTWRDLAAGTERIRRMSRETSESGSDRGSINFGALDEA